MNEKKSADYKKLVADMQKKYNVYNKYITPTDIDKKRAQNFAEKFDTPQKFLKSLGYRCAKWEESTDEALNYKRALDSLTLSIANGYDPKDPVALFAPVLNGETVCQEFNLYTYWQGFGYAEKTPKIKYLLVAQDWGNLFRRDPKDNQGILKMNKTGEWIAPYNEIPKRSGTDTNLFKFFEILGYDLLKLNDDLFFTNFCIGYRIGNEAGGMNKKLMMNDGAEFKRLCEILEPENILCLGKLTSECAYEALTGNGTWKKIYGEFKNYNDFLENHANLTVDCGNSTARFFPLIHCGVMGSLTRKFEKQLQDWKKIYEVNK